VGATVPFVIASTHSSKLSAHATLASHNALLGLSEHHHCLDLAFAAVLYARFLIAGELACTEVLDAVTKALFDNVELHLHLGPHFDFVIHFLEC